MRWIAAAMVLCALGCGDDDETTPVVEPPVSCAAGEWATDVGTCAPAGLPPDMPCPPAEWLGDDGLCIPAGVPPDGCGEGFVHDGDRGCEPILPDAPCPAGQLAVPGEMRCREVAPCAASPWGDIPVEPDTQYVDDSYSGMDSDGSALKPWTNVQAAIDAASAGAIVAIAEGSYLEDVTVSGKPVRLWGVCPALVELVGTGSEPQTVYLLDGASGSELRALSIRGDTTGIFSPVALDVLIERVWLHDNATRGIDVEAAGEPAHMTLRASLLEQNQEVGVILIGYGATVESSVVRTTQPNAQGFVGRGMSVQHDPGTGAPSTLVLRNSVVEQNHEVGIFVEGSTATVETSVVRDTQPDGQQIMGYGVSVKSHPNAAASTELLMRAAIVEESLERGIVVEGADAVVENSVVRATRPNPLGEWGRAVNVEVHPTSGMPSTLAMRGSLVEQCHEAGLFVEGSEATVETSVIRAILPNTEGLLGIGVAAVPHPTTNAPSSIFLRGSLVEETHEHGVFVEGSTATVETSIVRGAEPDGLGRGGLGVVAKGHGTTGALSTLVLRASIVEQAHIIGVFVEGSDATLETSVIRGTQPDEEGSYGHGAHAEEHPTALVPSTMLLRGTLLEQNHEVAVVIGDSVGTLEACMLRDTRPSPALGAGHGVIVFSEDGNASATVTRTRIHQSALAAAAVWGAQFDIGGSALSCQAFDLDRETYLGKLAELTDLGGNLCGCPEPTAMCKAVSAGLEPPKPLEQAP